MFYVLITDLNGTSFVIHFLELCYLYLLMHFSHFSIQLKLFGDKY